MQCKLKALAGIIHIWKEERGLLSGRERKKKKRMGAKDPSPYMVPVW